MSESTQLQHFNGINAVTGDYGLSMSAEELVQRVFYDSGAAALAQQQAAYSDAITNEKLKKEVTRGVRHGIDPTKLSETGWGILFAANDPNQQAIAEALTSLLALRAKQAGAHYRIFAGSQGYRPNESKRTFLERFGVGAGPVDPANGVPYYLLLIGSPDRIPYEFQYQLDVQFAVGRLDFTTLDEYANYAKAVVTAETGQRLAPTAAFFSVTNTDDSITAKTDQSLVQPVISALQNKASLQQWSVTSYRQQAATRSQLEALLGGPQKPALLFTSSHGVEFPLGDPRQETYQGALLCNEWPGPQVWDKRGEVPEAFYFAGDHLASTADPSGLIAFHFACYGGGTPQYYDFDRPILSSTSPGTAPKALAKRPFVAHLPKRLLGHPRGALAVVSHVDRAWSYSFTLNAQPQTTIFEDMLTILMEGKPLGWALECFHNRYAELAADLTTEINAMKSGRSTLAAFELATRWTENLDARNYIILGDPCVCVAVALPNTTVRPAAIPVDGEGKPLTISPTDWAQTPITVRTVLTNALQQLDQLNAQLAQNTAAAPVTPPPVFRDGGRSSGAQLRSAPTRGGVMRNGGTLRGGVTRSGQPPVEEDETKR